MTKSELIAKIATTNPTLTHAEVERVVNTVFDTVTDSLVDGERIELRGFGAFSVRVREARIGRNPRTGAQVKVSAKRVPFFKMGKELKERINNAK